MVGCRVVGVVGLGYVGLPIAVSFAYRGMRVIGFDKSIQRIEELRQGRDRTGEVGSEGFLGLGIEFTGAVDILQEADFYIIAVPTPVDEDCCPDLGLLCEACETVGGVLSCGDIVVFESTVYPGVTEKICVPLLESFSGLCMGRDFGVGYAPERMNTGDKDHSFEEVTKVIAANDRETLDIVVGVYERSVKGGIFCASSIMVAEAAKIIENTQRDVNIALVNEFSRIFHLLGVDTRDVLRTAATKWNFVRFYPGLVGGHCIPVDPYYLSACARDLGYRSEVILAGRRLNDSMAEFVAQQTYTLLQQRYPYQKTGFCVTIFGVTFKENVPDVRNSQVQHLAYFLRERLCTVQLHDPLVDSTLTEQELGMSLVALEDLKPAHALIFAVAHQFYRCRGWDLVKEYLLHREGGGFVGGIVVDIMGMLDRTGCPRGIELWRL